MQAVAEPTARQEAARATGNTDEAGAIAERLRMLYIDGKETREAYLAALATFDRANKVLGNARSDVLSKVL